MSSQTLITEKQKKQYKRFVEDAGDKALQQVNPDKDGLQRLFGNGGEFQSRIVTAIRELSVNNQFSDEEEESSYTYPEEYKGPKPIKDQIKAIATIFDLDPTKALQYANNLPELPNGAEGWFAIPSVEGIAAKYFPNVVDPAEKYCQAVQFALGKIAESRPFYNCREGEITKEKLRVNSRTASALEKLAEMQKGDILIIAAQLGMRHRGRSVRRAIEVFVPNEFGLGSLAVGSIALTHPERFVRGDELDVDCAGDEFDFRDGRFFGAPCVNHHGGKVHFDAHEISSAHSHYGAASAILPQ